MVDVSVHAPACGLGGVDPGDLEDALRSGDDVGYAVAAAPSQSLGPELGVLGSLIEQIQFQALELSVVKTGRVVEKRDALADELRGLLNQALGQGEVGRCDGECLGERVALDFRGGVALGIALVMGACVNVALLDGFRGNALLK